MYVSVRSRKVRRVRTSPEVMVEEISLKHVRLVLRLILDLSMDSRLVMRTFTALAIGCS